MVDKIFIHVLGRFRSAYFKLLKHLVGELRVLVQVCKQLSDGECHFKVSNLDAVFDQVGVDVEVSLGNLQRVDVWELLEEKLNGGLFDAFTAKDKFSDRVEDFSMSIGDKALDSSVLHVSFQS